LSLAYQSLHERQHQNEVVDIQKNILSAVGIPADGHIPTSEEVQQLYKENISEFVVNTEQGKIIRNLKPSEVDFEKTTDKLPLYVSTRDNHVAAYVVPVAGKGLWSTIYGYLALEPDANTVKGISFYKHGETPGLGGEVEKAWFQDNFKGKTIYNDAGELVAIGVAKGKVVESVSEDKRNHYVDGISGATMTGKGMTQFLQKDLSKYKTFFSNLQEKSGVKL
jgi:Na+-transporting NADH:ubiquinone oxidoreductase subunit C